MRRFICLLAVLFGTTLAVGRAAASTLVVFTDTPHGLYDFDTVTGDFTFRTFVAGSERFFGMDRRPSDGAVFAADLFGGGLWNVDIDTGATRRIGVLTPAIDRPEGIAFHPVTGELFVSSVEGDLYKVNPQTAATTFIGSSGLTLNGHTFTPDGSRLLAFRQTTGGLYEVDPVTGKASEISPGVPSVVPEDIAFTPDGRLFVTEYHGSMYEMDLRTGAARLAGYAGSSHGLLGMVVVPEPAIGSILGMVTLMQLRRPKRRCESILR